MRGEEEFVVQEIIDYRPADSHYLVRWMGYTEPTWEPLGSLSQCREALNDYVRASRSLTPVVRFARFEADMLAFQRMLDAAQRQVIVINEHDFVGPPCQEMTWSEDVVYGKGVVRPRAEFLAGCGENCQCSGGPNRCGCQDELGANYRDDKTLVAVHAVFECNENCCCAKTADRCNNRVVQWGESSTARLAIVRLPDERGWGVQALNFIPQGTFIDRYHGEMITQAEAEKRARQGLGSYLFDLDWASSPDTDGDDDYSDASTARTKPATYTIDARRRGSLSRFFNHSCSPNLQVVPVYLECHDPSMHGVAFFTACDIQEGQELCFDYTGGNHDAQRASKRRPCLCGAPACRKFIYI